MKSFKWPRKSSNFALSWIAYLVFERPPGFPEDAAFRTQNRMLDVLKTFILFRLKGSTPESRVPSSCVATLRPYTFSNFSVSENSALMSSRHFVMTATFTGSRRSGARSESSTLSIPTALPQISRRVFSMSSLTGGILRSLARL